MAARARKSNESFKKYRANLKKEAFQDRVDLRHTYVYVPYNHEVVTMIHGEKRRIYSPAIVKQRRHVDLTLRPTDRYYTPMVTS